MPWPAAYITNMFESEFSAHTGAVAGRPFTIRFIDNRKSKQARNPTV
jgi:hypothetical protein